MLPLNKRVPIVEHCRLHLVVIVSGEGRAWNFLWDLCISVSAGSIDLIKFIIYLIHTIYFTVVYMLYSIAMVFRIEPPNITVHIWKLVQLPFGWREFPCLLLFRSSKPVAFLLVYSCSAHVCGQSPSSRQSRNSIGMAVMGLGALWGKLQCKWGVGLRGDLVIVSE